MRQRKIFIHCSQEDIYGEKGRLLFSLVTLFSSHGYLVELFKGSRNWASGSSSTYLDDIENLDLVDRIPEKTEEWTCLYDKKDRSVSRLPWKRVIRIGFDIFSSYWLEDPMIVPYQVHPVHHMRDFNGNLKKLRGSEKRMRIFFSGDTSGYGRNRVFYPRAKLTRKDIIETICTQIRDRILIIQDESFPGELPESKYIDSCVIIDTKQTWIDDRLWPETLARADFFLCPPGIVMPMCHNIIEALALGVIPITNYPEWFDPNLEHMKNCIAFDSREDLQEKIKAVLSMDRELISELRSNALSYYDSRLRPEGFVDRLEARKDKKLTLLMISEKNMAKRAAKLGRNSVIIRGTGDDREKGFFHKALRRLKQRPGL